MAWTDHEKVDTTLKYLLVQAETMGTTQFEWDDPSGEPVSVLSMGSNNEPFLMGRLSNVQAVLEAMEYPPELSVNLAVQLSDPLMEANQGRFLWQISQGKSRLVRQGNPPDDPITDSLKSELISIDIATFSRVYFGQKSVREIVAEKNATSMDQEKLAIMERIFPVCRNYISEYF
jgi:predicted acetyltransferase